MSEPTVATFEIKFEDDEGLTFKTVIRPLAPEPLPPTPTEPAGE